MKLPPVIFLVFNRPELTQRVFARIREARPPQLYIVCDGPRSAVPGDEGRVQAVRKIIEDGVDWPCEVYRDYAESNLGCRDRVGSGLNAAFKIFEEAIILEDDCLPDPSFFSFCIELLERYRDDHDVMHINGYRPVRRYAFQRSDISFSSHPLVWGWATWANRWKHHKEAVSGLSEMIGNTRFMNRILSEVEKNRLIRNWRLVNDRKLDSWAYLWSYSVIAKGGLAIVPRVNLVANLGLNDLDATHTKGVIPTFMTRRSHAIKRITKYPAQIEQDIRYDRELEYLNNPNRIFWKRLIMAIILRISFLR